ASAVTGLSILAFLPVQPATVLLGAGITGIGGGTIYSALPVLIAEAVPERETGTVNGINTIIRTIAMAILSQVTTVVLVTVTPPGQDYPLRAAFTVDFSMSALLNLLALLLVPCIVVAGARRGRGGSKADTHPKAAAVRRREPAAEESKQRSWANAC